MLTKREYELLKDIEELPNHGFPETECPSYLHWPDVAQIITLGYMEYATLSLPGDDPRFPEGRSWVRISANGYHLIEEYEERLSERKLETAASVVGHIVSAVTKG